MTILNKYVIKQFVRPFWASFITLCILILVSQIFDRLDSFLAEGVSLRHVAGYLLTSMPFQAMNILPVACLLGTLFVVGTMARTKEYIAALAGGIPPEKFMGGILLCGIVISMVALLANETVIPPTTSYSRKVQREKIKRLGDWRHQVFHDLSVAGRDGRLWSIKQFNLETGEMQRVVIDTYKDGRFGPQIDATTAKWIPDQGWLFTKGAMREFTPNNRDIAAIHIFEEKMIPLSEKPVDLVIQEPQPEEMNYKTLSDHIDRLSKLGVPTRKLQVELQMKLAFPFACFVVTCLGIPLAMRGKGNRAMGIAAGGALTLAYMGFIQFGKALAQRLVFPWLGAWLGNIVFLIVALYLWVRLRRSA